MWGFCAQWCDCIQPRFLARQENSSCLTFLSLVEVHAQQNLIIFDSYACKFDYTHSCVEAARTGDLPRHLESTLEGNFVDVKMERLRQEMETKWQISFIWKHPSQICSLPLLDSKKISYSSETIRVNMNWRSHWRSSLLNNHRCRVVMNNEASSVLYFLSVDWMFFARSPLSVPNSLRVDFVLKLLWFKSHVSHSYYSTCALSHSRLS